MIQDYPDDCIAIDTNYSVIAQRASSNIWKLIRVSDNKRLAVIIPNKNMTVSDFISKIASYLYGSLT